MPQSCPKCGWSNIRKSFEPHTFDRVLRLLFLKPFRCRTCRHRFFWLSL
jgi:hypothetical protein